MTTLQGSVPKDPRVEALPIMQDLRWEIQKYLRHPTAELLAGKWEDVFKGMLDRQRIFLCFEPWSARQKYPEPPYSIRYGCNPNGNEYMNRWQEHLDEKYNDSYPPAIRGDRFQQAMWDFFRRR